MVIFISAGAFRVLRVPYKKKNLWLCRGRGLWTFSFGKKNLSQQKQKNTTAQHISERAKTKFSFPSKSIHPYKIKEKFLFSLFSFKKQHSSLTKGYSLNFQAKIINQNGEHPLKGESILHQHLFSTPFFVCLLFYLTYYWFNLSFYFCCCLFTNHFYLFSYILVGVLMWIYGGSAQRPMVCHGLIM